MVIVTLLAFISAIINVPFAIAYIRGLNFDTKGVDCPEDVKEIEKTKKIAKGIQIFNAIAFVLLVVLSSI
jgi:hypothetical protein